MPKRIPNTAMGCWLCLPLRVFQLKVKHSPDLSKNVVNAVNLEVKFINFHHSLQRLKLPYLHLIFEEDVNFDLDVIQNLHHILNFWERFLVDAFLYAA